MVSCQVLSQKQAQKQKIEFWHEGRHFSVEPELWHTARFSPRQDPPSDPDSDPEDDILVQILKSISLFGNAKINFVVCGMGCLNLGVKTITVCRGKMPRYVLRGLVPCDGEVGRALVRAVVYELIIFNNSNDHLIKFGAKFPSRRHSLFIEVNNSNLYFDDEW